MIDHTGQKKGRRWLWISFVVLVPLLSIAFGFYSGFLYVNRPTVEKTLSAFCSAVQSGDDAKAYAQLSSAYQHAYPRQQFESDLAGDKVTSCIYGSVRLSGIKAVSRMSLVHASGMTNSNMISLSQDAGSNSEWTITSGIHLSTPLKTMTTFCNAVQHGDYKTAHSQLVNIYQQAYPEQQFASDIVQDKVISCTHAAIVISGSTASTILTLVHASKMTNTDIISLSQDGNNIWKIENGIHLSTPLETLNTFCNALQSGNYQMAYMQFSQDFQKTVPEQDFAGAFAQNNGVSCSHEALTISGNSATAMVKLASAYNTLVLLVQDSSNAWKIGDVRLL